MNPLATVTALRSLSARRPVRFHPLLPRASALATLVVLTGTITYAGDWPAWRGPHGTGIAAEKNLPMQWSRNDNVRWRVDLPDRGNSSPIVSGDRVFVAQATTRDGRRALLCFDRKEGKLLWQSGVTYTENEQTQRDNPYCSATPVTDGERVITSFGSAGLYCYDFAGKEIWRRDFGKMSHMFGNASSPILVGDLCVFPFGPDEKARLIAVNKRTGETVWEAEPPKIDPSEQQRQRGPGGGGGGDRRGFDPGTALARQMLATGDGNKDSQLSPEEFGKLSSAWFAQLDKDRTGKLDAATFAQRFNELLPQPPDAGGPDGERRGGGGGRRFGGERSIAPGLFSAADADKDGSLTSAEWQTTFAQWFASWDTAKSGILDEAKIASGLNAALPRPQFGGPGGGGRPGGGGGTRGGPGGASWSTPVLVKAADREEIVMTFPGRVVGLDPKTGKQLWVSKGIGGTVYSSPAIGDGIVFAGSGGPGGGGAVALKLGGSGDVSESHRQWQLERFKSTIGSAVVHDGHLYSISQDGIASCTELSSGKTVWEERLRGSGNRGGSWSSMLLADGKIYVPNQSGDVFVLAAAPKFELLATNSVNEATNASLAVSNGDLFLRTDKSLWCFAGAK